MKNIYKIAIGVGSAAVAGVGFYLFKKSKKNKKYFDDVEETVEESQERETSVEEEHVYSTATTEIPDEPVIVKEVEPAPKTDIPVKKQGAVKRKYKDLTSEEFQNCQNDDISQETLTLFADGKMYDEAYQRVYAKDTIGMERYKKIIPGQCEEIFVLNMETNTMYDVVFDDRCSTDVVHYESAEDFDE